MKVYCTDCKYHGANIMNRGGWKFCYAPTNYKKIDIKHFGNWAWQHTKSKFKRNARKMNHKNNCPSYKEIKKT